MDDGLGLYGLGLCSAGVGRGLGLVDGDRAPQLCGRLSSLRLDASGYFAGDLDYAQFQTLQARTVEIDLEWNSDADLRLFLLSQGSEAFLESGDGDEVQLPAGFHLLVVAGVEGPPTDYVLQIAP